MNVQQASSPTATSQSAKGNEKENSTSEIGDRFMALLTTQLTNQDPTEPMESSELTAQLAQLAQLEQSEAANKHLQNLGAVVANMGNISTMNTVGSNARIGIDKFDWDATKGMDVEGTILTDGQNLDRDYQIHVKDENNQIIKTIDAKLENGELTYVWDGTDEGGNKVNSGKYQFEVGYNDEIEGFVKDKEAVATVASKISSMQFWPVSVTGLDNGVSVEEAMILEIMNGSNAPADDSSNAEDKPDSIQ